MKNKGLKPAFPFIEEITGNYGEKYWQTTPGQSKRFYAACAAMQGLLSNPYPDIIWLDNKVICEMAYMFADKLLTQEEDGQED